MSEMATLEKQLDQRNKLLEERNEQVSVLTSAIVDLRDEVLRLRKQWDNAQVKLNANSPASEVTTFGVNPEIEGAVKVVSPEQRNTGEFSVLGKKIASDMKSFFMGSTPELGVKYNRAEDVDERSVPNTPGSAVTAGPVIEPSPLKVGLVTPKHDTSMASVFNYGTKVTPTKQTPEAVDESSNRRSLFSSIRRRIFSSGSQPQAAPEVQTPFDNTIPNPQFSPVEFTEPTVLAPAKVHLMSHHGDIMLSSNPPAVQNESRKFKNSEKTVSKGKVAHNDNSKSVKSTGYTYGTRVKRKGKIEWRVTVEKEKAESRSRFEKDEQEKIANAARFAQRTVVL